MKTITDITIATTKDGTFIVDYDLDGYEGSTEFFTLSATRILIEDTVSFAVDRDARKVISERATELLSEGADLVTIDVVDLRTEGGYFDADLQWLRNGISYNTTINF